MFGEQNLQKFYDEWITTNRVIVQVYIAVFPSQGKEKDYQE